MEWWVVVLLVCAILQVILSLPRAIAALPEAIRLVRRWQAQRWVRRRGL